MNHRKLRIAWSVAWGIVAVLLVVLWVRSYSRRDILTLAAKMQTVVSSLGGTISVNRFSSLPSSGWNWDTTPTSEIDFRIAAVITARRWSYTAIPSVTAIRFPSWFGAVVLILIAALPWFPLIRFSLRTLLIATTLVAVGLGLIVWLTR